MCVIPGMVVSVLRWSHLSISHGDNNNWSHLILFDLVHYTVREVFKNSAGPLRKSGKEKTCDCLLLLVTNSPLRQ